MDRRVTRERRQPVVTLGIMGVCCFAFLATRVVGRSTDDAAMAIERELAKTTSNPQVQLCPMVVPSASQGSSASTEQRRVEELCDALQATRARHPLRRFGFRGASELPGLFTYMFLHDGWLHLLGNLAFFAVPATSLEARWGPRAFAAFFLAAGVVAALAQAAATEGPGPPLIGSSGAVYGTIGAFIVCFAGRTRLVVLFGRRLTLLARPAYLLLSFWVGVVLLESCVFKARGVPVLWANLGGFALGVAVAVVLRAMGYERARDDGQAVVHSVR